MRVGLLIYGSLDAISGGFLYDRKLVEYLQRQGDKVEVISLEWRSYPHHLLDNLSPALYRRLVNLDVDILLQDELAHPSLFLTNRRLKDQVIYPIVSIVHHLRVSEIHPRFVLRLYHQIERAYLRTNDGYIFNSQTTREVVHALAGSSLKPYTVAYPGGQFGPEIDYGEIIARAHQAGPLKLLFIGNLIPRKSLHTLLDALETLPPGTATLTVVGGYLSDSKYGREMINRMKKFSHENSQWDCTTYLGVLPAEKLAEVLRAHHVIAVPSAYEGYGIVYLEGMGYGLPAIATNRGAAGEIITHNRHGFLLPPDDPAALAGTIQKLAANRDLLAELSLAARRRYLEHPTWEQTGYTIRQYLQNLATRRFTVV